MIELRRHLGYGFDNKSEAQRRRDYIRTLRPESPTHLYCEHILEKTFIELAYWLHRRTLREFPLLFDKLEGLRKYRFLSDADELTDSKYIAYRLTHRGVLWVLSGDKFAYTWVPPEWSA